jgi:hypothetical protein
VSTPSHILHSLAKLVGKRIGTAVNVAHQKKKILACQFGHVCHRFASSAIVCSNAQIPELKRNGNNNDLYPVSTDPNIGEDTRFSDIHDFSQFLNANA